MKGLSLYLKRDIECEDGQLFKPENIDKYDNNFDIAAGIGGILKIDRVFISGIHRDMTFGRDMIDRIKNSKNRQDEFEKIAYEIQNLEAHEPTPAIYEKDNELIVKYMFIEKTPIILHFNPSLGYRINYGNGIKDENIADWFIDFLVQDEKEGAKIMENINYSEFIGKLPKEKYRFIDETSIFIEPLEKEEINGLKGEFKSFV